MPKIPRRHGPLLTSPGDKQRALAANFRIRGEGLQTKNAHKGFCRFIGHFKPIELVAATVWVDEGLHKDHGWAVFVRQGSRRCILSGGTLDRPKEDVSREAMTTFVDFGPAPNKPIEFESVIFFPGSLLTSRNRSGAIWKTFQRFQPIIIMTFAWSGPRVVAGYTEARACAWHVCQLVLSGP
jgi:hypothetical protein